MLSQQGYLTHGEADQSLNLCFQPFGPLFCKFHISDIYHIQVFHPPREVLLDLSLFILFSFDHFISIKSDQSKSGIRYVEKFGILVLGVFEKQSYL